MKVRKDGHYETETERKSKGLHTAKREDQTYSATDCSYGQSAHCTIKAKATGKPI